MWIVFTCFGVWIIVLQNFGLGGSRSVRVESGRIEAEMNNAVDVNLYSINGYRNCFYKYGYESKYCRIPISD